MKTPVRPTEAQNDQGCEKRVHLAGFENDQLSEEAAQQLIALNKDRNRPTHRGRDLPSASLLDLLSQIDREAE